MALSQSLQQKLLQKFSPQQIQVMKLLQVPTANIEERIKEELEENPALELEDPSADEYQEDLKDEFEGDNEDFELDGNQNEYDEVDVSEYVSDGDDEVGDYRLKDDNYPEFNDQKVLPVKDEISFHGMLLNQLQLLSLDKDEYIIAEQIIGSIDDDGYLRRTTIAIVDDLAFRQNIITTEKKVEAIIKQIQQFDPVGVAARDLQECLLIQLMRKKEDGEDTTLAIKIIKHYFNEFVKKHYEKIQRSLNLNDDELKELLAQIIRCNPKPGGQSETINKAETYIIPDFFVYNNNGNLELTLNSRNAPDLRISADYKEMFSDYTKSAKKDKQQKEAVLFIKQKIDAAKWFIDAIKQRQETMFNSMTQIMTLQKNFFLSGDEAQLKPMILKDIAEKTNLDISTISRVANSKYVQTEYGTYKLKYFFSDALTTDSGEEVSTREVKSILNQIITAEDKKQPLSDEQLVTMMTEKGFNIARRTIAKYREQLNIPVARLRKML
jgi:RNA polymerase sigma-54 factor